MNYIDLFLDTSKPLVTPRFKVVEADWLKLCQIFPEPGFRSYFAGFIVSKLVKELHENGIDTYFDRTSDPRAANLPGFLSNVRLIGDAPSRHDGGRTDSSSNETAISPRDAGNHEVPAVGYYEKGEITEVESEARLESPRSIVLKNCFHVCTKLYADGKSLPFDHTEHNKEETIYGFLNRMTTGELEALHQKLISSNE